MPFPKIIRGNTPYVL